MLQCSACPAGGALLCSTLEELINNDTLFHERCLMYQKSSKKRLTEVTRSVTVIEVKYHICFPSVSVVFVP